MIAQNELIFKILILGESRVGKSSILNQFTENVFTENLPPTLGIDYKIKKIKIDDVDVKLQIWDTAGQERFRSITEGFYKGCHGVLLVFDLTDQDSFKRIKQWIESIKNKASEDVVISLIGNKSDLKKNGIDAIPQNDIQDFVKEQNLRYFEGSAKLNINVQESFTYLASEMKGKFYAQNENFQAIDGGVKERQNNCC